MRFVVLFALVALPFDARATTSPKPCLECRTTNVLKPVRDRERECGTPGYGGPDIGTVPFTPAGSAEKTAVDERMELRLQATLRAPDDVPGSLTITTPEQRKRIEVTGNLGRDHLWVTAYLGKRSTPEKPDCEYSHYVTVSCELKR